MIRTTNSNEQTLQTGTKLTLRLQIVNVVATNVVLSQVNNGACQAHFTMVVTGVLGHVTSKLRNFKLCG